MEGTTAPAASATQLQCFPPPASSLAVAVSNVVRSGSAGRQPLPAVEPALLPEIVGRQLHPDPAVTLAHSRRYFHQPELQHDHLHPRQLGAHQQPAHSHQDPLFRQLLSLTLRGSAGESGIAQDRQVAVGAVVEIVVITTKVQRLLVVREIFWRIKFQDDLEHCRLQVLLDEGADQCGEDPEQFQARDYVLQTGEGRLATQRRALFRGTLHGTCEERVLPESVCIIGLLVAAGAPVAPLVDQVLEGIRHLGRVASVFQYREGLGGRTDGRVGRAGSPRRRKRVGRWRSLRRHADGLLPATRIGKVSADGENIAGQLGSGSVV